MTRAVQLAPEIATQAWDAIDDLARSLLPNSQRPPEVDSRWSTSILATGPGGAALFYYYLYRATGRSTARDASLEILDHVVREAGRSPLHFGLFEGITGVAWLIEHVGIPLGAYDERANDALDAALLAMLDNESRPLPYDLVSGLVGLGVYALERSDRAIGGDLLQAIVKRLLARAVVSPEGVTWVHEPVDTPDSDLSGTSRIDFGIAHGIAGAIAFLSVAYCAMVSLREAIGPTLRRSVDFMLHNLRGDDHIFLCPNMREVGRTVWSWRPSWCYGDFSVAIALRLAAAALDDASCLDVARRIIQHGEDRYLSSFTALDVGLCHGGLGNARVLARFALDGYNDGSAATIDRFVRDSVAARQPGAPYGGFLIMQNEGPKRFWSPLPGLLSGSAGVGLALLAFTSDIDPEWESLMFLRPTPRTVSPLTQL